MDILGGFGRHMKISGIILPYTSYMQKTVRAASLPENQLFKLKFLLTNCLFFNFRGNITIDPDFPAEIFFVAA